MYKAADPVSQYTDLELALMVLLDVFGKGNKRREALGQRFTKIQSIVNQIIISGLIPALSREYGEERVRKVLETFRPTDEEYDAFINEFLDALKEVNYE